METDEQIVYGEPLGPRVTEVQPIPDFRLLLTFTNGERRIFDAKHLLEMSAFKPLRDKSTFESVKAEYGTVLWPHDIDYCPDSLYAESFPAR